MKTRDEWGPGPWDDEPDEQRWSDEVTGLRCFARRNPDLGVWSGYVGVPPRHPLFRTDREEERVQGLAVHGGVNFGGHWKGDDKGLWWFGFDCAHAMDYLPAFPNLNDRANYRTLEYVHRQCLRLAAQLHGLLSDEDIDGAIEELPL
jgi:hypothetical protein